MKSIISMAKIFFPAVMGLTLLSGCVKGPEVDLIKDYKSQQKWLSAAKTMPVINAGDHMKNGLWHDPVVIKDGDQYVMYITTSIEDPWKPPILPFRAISKDGIKWTLNPGKPLLSAEDTPFVNNETVNVVKYKGKYHMYYTGVYPAGDVPSMAIGHAVSNDGIVWKNSKKPVLEATGNPSDWNGYLVAEPGAVVFKGKIYLYFTAMAARASGTPPQRQTIGLAISSDGVNFDKQRPVLEQSEIYPPEKGFVGYSTPSALEYNGNMHLFYDIAAFGENNDPQWHQLAFHHAVSSDGISNFKEDKLPMLTRNDFSWTSGEVIGPTVLIDGDKIKLWFSGHVKYSELGRLINNGMKGPEVGIGYAEMALEEFLKE